MIAHVPSKPVCWFGFSERTCPQMDPMPAKAVHRALRRQTPSSWLLRSSTQPVKSLLSESFTSPGRVQGVDGITNCRPCEASPLHIHLCVCATPVHPWAASQQLLMLHSTTVLINSERQGRAVRIVATADNSGMTTQLLRPCFRISVARLQTASRSRSHTQKYSQSRRRSHVTKCAADEVLRR